MVPHSYLLQRSGVTSGALLFLSERSPSCKLWCNLCPASLPDVGAARRTPGRTGPGRGGRRGKLSPSWHWLLREGLTLSSNARGCLQNPATPR